MAVTNFMSVDFEDNYCDLPFSTWGNYDSRIHITSKILLDLFEKYNVRATFFTVGYVAQKHPHLIEEIVSKGHEIASHSFSHKRTSTLDTQAFEQELTQSKKVLEKISGEKVLGFRTPYFLNGKELWSFPIMKKHFLYDSSIFPVGFHYDFAEAITHIYRMSSGNPLEEDATSNFLEIPMTTMRIPLVGNIPVAGGIYLRLLPYQLLKSGIRRVNKLGHPAMFYIHPEDLHPTRSHLPGYSWHYFWGLKSARKKLEGLLKIFAFSSVREILDL